MSSPMVVVLNGGFKSKLIWNIDWNKKILSVLIKLEKDVNKILEDMGE